MDSQAVKLLMDIQDQSYKNALELFVSQLTNKIDALQVQVLELTKGLHVTQAEVADLKSQVKHLVRDQVDEGNFIKCNNPPRCPPKIAESLKSRCNYFDNYSHNRNLYLCGLEEFKSEAYEQLANRVIVLLHEMLEVPNVSLEQVSRVGQPCDATTPRPLLLTFSRPNDRNAVLRNSNILRGSDIHIYEELHPVSLQLPGHGMYTRHSLHTLNGNDAHTSHTENGFTSEPHTPVHARLSLPAALYDQHLASSAPSLALYDQRESSSSLVNAESSIGDDTVRTNM